MKIRKTYVINGMIVLTSMIFLLDCMSSEVKEKEFKMIAQSMARIISQSASACQNQCMAYRAAWEYARASEIDFKEASRQMLSTRPAQFQVNMEDLNRKIVYYLEKLDNPPKKYRDVSDKLREMHEHYAEIFKFAVNPPESPDEFYFEKVDSIKMKIEAIQQELNIFLVSPQY